MTNKTTNTVLGLTLSLLLASMPSISHAASPTDPATIQVFADARIDTASLRRAMATIFRAAASRHADVRVKLFDAGLVGEWAPPKPLGMSDYNATLLRIIKGASEREREKESGQRFAAAVASFDDYLQKAVPVAGKCSKLLSIAQAIAAGSEKTTVVVLAEGVCPTPRVRLQLAVERALVIMLAPAIGSNNVNEDCALLGAERRLHTWFATASIMQLVGPETLAQVLAKGNGSPASGQLVVYPCSQSVPLHPVGGGAPAVAPAVGGVDQGEPDPPAGLRVITPRPHAHVGRIVPYQGDGASSGETLLSVVRVGSEFWPQDFVQAKPDGTFVGEVVAGRPFADCQVEYVLRVFRNVRQSVEIGVPLSSWPAGDGSLPVVVVRTEGCGATM